MINVAIADDHPIVRAGVIKTLQGEPDMTVVGEAGTGREAILLCEAVKPDVLVLDFEMPDLDGLEVTSRLQEIAPDIRVVILTVHKGEDFAARFMQAGARGFVPKLAAADELAAAIRIVASGRLYFAPAESAAPKDNAGAIAGLTRRELQFLICFASGKDIVDIANEYAVSQSTVKTVKARILEKLKLRNVADLTRFAIHNKLIG